MTIMANIKTNSKVFTYNGYREQINVSISQFCDEIGPDNVISIAGHTHSEIDRGVRYYLGDYTVWYKYQEEERS